MNPSGLCQCGCGRPAPLAQRTDKKRGYIKGQSVRFIPGHNNKPAENPIPLNTSGLCQCGCGRKTRVAPKTVRSKGWVKGEPIRFILGHSGNKPQPHYGPGPNPSGLCMCGCGGKTPLASCSDKGQGEIKGQPRRYVAGHQRRRQGPAYVVDPGTGCWEWQGSKDKRGYGLMRDGRRMRRAHIVMYEQKYGPVPDGKELDHFACDNPSCCNPDHVRAVTHAENMARYAQVRRQRMKDALPSQIVVSRNGDGTSRVEVFT